MQKYADQARAFTAAMQRAGLKVEHYDGRSRYSGPAVRVNNLQDALSKTSVPCQWDQMGMGFIVYPR